MYINMPKKPKSFSLLNIGFTDCKATIGRNIYINCYSLIDIIDDSIFKISQDKEDETSAVGYDDILLREIALIYFKPYLSDTIYINSEVGTSKSGFDKVWCGRTEMPCASINMGLSHL